MVGGRHWRDCRRAIVANYYPSGGFSSIRFVHVSVLTGVSGRALDGWWAKLTVIVWLYPIRFERVHVGMLLLLYLYM